MSDVSVQYVAGAAGRIAYGRRGAGAPVVLLHPLALAGQVWHGLAERLEGRYDVLTPDARGHGASDWDGEPFSIDDMAVDVVALLDGLGLERAHVVGMSMGGSVAIRLAAHNPGRVDRLLLADTTAWYGDEAVATWNERADRVLATTRAAQVPFQVDRWFTDGFRRTHPRHVQEVVAGFLATDSAAHAQACRAMGAMDSRELLPRITAPTLAIAGEEDYATPPSMGQYAAEHVVDGRALTLAGLRHLSLVERPELDGVVTAHLEGRKLPDVSAASCGCAVAPRPDEAGR